MITGEEFTKNAMNRNFKALQDKLRKAEQEQSKFPETSVVEVVQATA
jgi:hypothetical protein